MKDGCTDDITERKLHQPVLQCSGNSKNLDCMMIVATLHFSSSCCCILPDCLGAVMSLTRLDEPIKTSCQHHHCHDDGDDGDDGVGDDDGDHNDHDHSQDCDDATADATWHS